VSTDVIYNVHIFYMEPFFCLEQGILTFTNCRYPGSNNLYKTDGKF